MATHNPKESRAACETTLAYMYRGENHEHEIGTIIHLGGNLLSHDPIRYCAAGVEVNLESISEELNAQARLHRGKGEDLFKHYVVSLAPGEMLKDYQWLEFITSYMEALGYDRSTKWTAVEHRDTDSSHVHILACRVKNDRYGSLVGTYKDYERGWPVMREYERKFELRQLENPDENFGLNKSKRQLKYEKNFGSIISLDEADSIRAAFKKLYSTFGKPKNMRDLVLGLAKCGVDVNVSTNSGHEISGISYRLKSGSGKWISGSKVKATRFTWTTLQKKEGISYDPRRDDPFLRKDDRHYEIYINLEEYSDPSLIIFESNLRFQQQRFLLARFRRKQDMDVEAIMLLIKVIMIILKILFRVSLDQHEVEFLFGPVTYESPELNTVRNIEEPVLGRIFERHNFQSDFLKELEFSLHPQLMSTHRHSHEASYR